MNPPKSLERIGRIAPAGGPDVPALDLGEYQGRLGDRVRAWESEGFARRLWARDPTLWVSGPVSEIANRLGWLDLPANMEPRVAGIGAFAQEITDEGFTHAVLMGMGGSSLAPELFQTTFGAKPGFPELVVLDSTHPAAVADVERRIDLSRTLFIFSSKSGTTVEPLSFFRYFWSRVSRVTDSPGRRFVAVTDPGTPLAALAAARNFRRVFEAAPNVGGRFSALTEFGLLPAAIIGVDIERLLASAGNEARANAAGVSEGKAPAFLLGAALGEVGLQRDKLTIMTSPALRSFPDWLEQLIAESTGKDGKGIVPVVGEPSVPAARYGEDRVFVSLAPRGDPDAGIEGLTKALEKAGHPVIRIRTKDLDSLGGQIFLWEMAVAAAGAVLGIHPFNQPDVELAKELARKAMARPTGADSPGTSPEETVPADDAAALQPAFDRWLGQARPGDYFAIQAFLAPQEETSLALYDLRLALLSKTGLATTQGYGPRFLHSTGQLHKGGPDEALVLQLVDEPEQDLAVPEADFTFGGLIRAQALGDYQALRRRGRRVLRVNLRHDPVGGIGLLRKWAGV